jgi:hypothetical protein
VDPRSLVALRRVTAERLGSARGLCSGGGTERLALGYRYPTDDRPYEIAIAAFRDGAALCGVYGYEQL